MAQQHAAAHAYAKAVFELARERGQVEAIGRELDAFAEQFAVEPSLRDFFARPWVTGTVKRATAVEIATRLGLSQLTRDLVGLAAAQGRAEQLASIGGAYRDLVDRDLGRVRVRVRTTVPLTEDEHRMLSARLLQALGGNEVVLEEAVDRTLLGGFIAESGSYVVDGSLEGQLDRMRERLEKG
jgi:F-type H+-transporting ATPase subunit delta